MPIVIEFGPKEEYEVLPEGDYLLKIEGHDMKVATTGNDMLVFRHEVLEPEIYAGRKMWDQITLVKASEWKLRQLLVAAGYSKDELVEDFEFEPADLYGVVVLATVVNEPYEGSMQAKIKRYRAADEGRSVKVPF